MAATKKKPCKCKKGTKGKSCDCPSHGSQPRWKRDPSFDAPNIPAGKPGSHLGWAPAGPGM